jgi:hypothetical protein
MRRFFDYARQPHDFEVWHATLMQVVDVAR